MAKHIWTNVKINKFIFHHPGYNGLSSQTCENENTPLLHSDSRQLLLSLLLAQKALAAERKKTTNYCEVVIEKFTSVHWRAEFHSSSQKISRKNFINGFPLLLMWLCVIIFMFSFIIIVVTMVTLNNVWWLKIYFLEWKAKAKKVLSTLVLLLTSGSGFVTENRMTFLNDK